MATIDYKQKIKDYMNSSEVDTLYKSMLNNLFPELKESEDERIRKEFCKDIWTFIPNEKAHKYITWLEKQGKKERDARYKYLEELLEADTIYQMAMNDAMVAEAKNKAINALQELSVSKLLGLKKLEKRGKQKSQRKSGLVVPRTHGGCMV